MHSAHHATLIHANIASCNTSLHWPTTVAWCELTSGRMLSTCIITFIPHRESTNVKTFKKYTQKNNNMGKTFYKLWHRVWNQFMYPKISGCWIDWNLFNNYNQDIQLFNNFDILSNDYGKTLRISLEIHKQNDNHWPFYFMTHTHDKYINEYC